MRWAKCEDRWQESHEFDPREAGEWEHPRQNDGGSSDGGDSDVEGANLMASMPSLSHGDEGSESTSELEDVQQLERRGLEPEDVGPGLPTPPSTPLLRRVERLEQQLSYLESRKSSPPWAADEQRSESLSPSSGHGEKLPRPVTDVLKDTKEKGPLSERIATLEKRMAMQSAEEQGFESPHPTRPSVVTFHEDINTVVTFVDSEEETVITFTDSNTAAAASGPYTEEVRTWHSTQQVLTEPHLEPAAGREPYTDRQSEWQPIQEERQVPALSHTQSYAEKNPRQKWRKLRSFLHKNFSVKSRYT